MSNENFFYFVLFFFSSLAVYLREKRDSMALATTIGFEGSDESGQLLLFCLLGSGSLNGRSLRLSRFFANQ